MATLTASLTAVRYYTAADPYYYTIDNRPLTDITTNVALLATFLDSKQGVANSTSSTPTLDLAVASTFTLAPTANITAITISNPYVTGKNEFMVIFTQDASARTITWPASVKWPGGVAPTLTATSGKKDVFRLTSADAGVTWLAATVGQNY